MSIRPQALGLALSSLQGADRSTYLTPWNPFLLLTVKGHFTSILNRLFKLSEVHPGKKKPQCTRYLLTNRRAASAL